VVTLVFIEEKNKDRNTNRRNSYVVFVLLGTMVVSVSFFASVDRAQPASEGVLVFILLLLMGVSA